MAHLIILFFVNIDPSIWLTIKNIYQFFSFLFFHVQASSNYATFAEKLIHDIALSCEYEISIIFILAHKANIFPVETIFKLKGIGDQLVNHCTFIYVIYLFCYKKKIRSNMEIFSSIIGMPKCNIWPYVKKNDHVTATSEASNFILFRCPSRVSASNT